MGRPLYCIPHGYAGCGLIVDNNILIVLRAGTAKFIVYYSQTLYRPAFQPALHETQISTAFQRVTIIHITYYKIVKFAKNLVPGGLQHFIKC